MANLWRNNLAASRKRWKAELSELSIQMLKSLTVEYQFSVAEGDLIWLERGWYATHAGLLRLALRNRCAGIHTRPATRLCDPKTHHWSFQATVFRTKTCLGFVGYGDADPTNVSSLVRGSEMRVAETRAVNRALRKAYGVGICSVEEIGTIPNPAEKLPPQKSNGNGNGSGPKVRDRLCQLIRQHKLDPTLVKAYAVDFCGTKTLREASRDQIENFIQQLGDWAEKDRNALLCQLNTYLPAEQKVVA
jgi:hypothetical protein